MSVGTIVTIVLLMSVLVLGLFLVQNIFKSAKGAVDLTEQQLQSEINKLFGSDEARVVIFPSSKAITIKSGNTDAIGVGIRNIATSVGESTIFSYTVSLSENNCGLTSEKAERFINIGKSRDDLEVPISRIESYKVIFNIPEETPNCLLEYTIKVYRDGSIYDSDYFQVTIK